MVRLDRFLATYGGVTRSEAKKILKKGCVTVSGTVRTQPEYRLDPEQEEVCVDGKPLSWKPFLCLMLHKPSGYVTATEDRHQKTVLDLVDHPRKKELFPVGRLDLDTEGLLLLMNDGALAHRLLSPRHHAEKTYFARVEGRVTGEDAEAFARGVDIKEKALTLPAKLEIISSNSISEVFLTICEGKFHQVRRMFEARDKKVLYLKRVSMAGLQLDETLARGSWRELTKEETEKLQAYDRRNESSDF